MKDYAVACGLRGLRRLRRCAVSRQCFEGGRLGQSIVGLDYCWFDYGAA